MHGSTPSRSLRRSEAAALLSLVLLLLGASPAAGQHLHPAPEDASGLRPLHFSHPMIGESVSPESEARLEHSREGASRLTEVSLGYAPTRGFGVDVALSVETLDDGGVRLGTPHLGLHFAHFGLADRGILLGYGVELSPPARQASHGTSEHGTSEHGAAEHSHAPVRPFVSLGYKSGGLELIASGGVGIDAGARGAGGAARGLGYSLSALHPLAPRVDGSLEAYGGGAGEALHLAPGLRIRLRPGVSLGIGASGALEGPESAGIRTVVSAAYHW